MAVYATLQDLIDRFGSDQDVKNQAIRYDPLKVTPVIQNHRLPRIRVGYHHQRFEYF